MKVLLANEEQLRQLDGYTSDQSIINFVKDGNGNMIIGTEVLDDPSFKSIKESLVQLTQIEHTPVIINEWE